MQRDHANEVPYDRGTTEQEAESLQNRRGQRCFRASAAAAEQEVQPVFALDTALED